MNENQNDLDPGFTKIDPARLPAEVRAQMLATETSMYLNPYKFEHAQRVAMMLSKSSLVPDRYKNKPGDCFIALDFANRINAHPLMLMQSMYVVYGTPGLEGKLVASLVNQSNKYEGEIEYEWLNGDDEPISESQVVNNHEADGRGCRAFAKSKQTGKVLYGPKVTWKIVHEEGWYADKPRKPPKQGVIKSKWKTIPQVMFPYRAASWFANRYCPEVKLGMMTTEEIHDVHDLEQIEPGVFGPSTESDISSALKKHGGAQEEKEQPGTEEDTTGDTKKTEQPADIQEAMKRWDKDFNNLRSGFEKAVLDNEAFFRKFDEINKLGKAKWQRISQTKDKPWPYDQPPPTESPESAGMDNDRLDDDEDLIEEKHQCPECKEEFSTVDEVKDHVCEKPIEKFDRLVEEKTYSHEVYGPDILNAFVEIYLEKVANINEMNIAVLKTQEVKDFETFWNEFLLWLSKQDMTSYTPGGQDDETELEVEDMVKQIRNNYDVEVRREAYANCRIKPGDVLSTYPKETVKKVLEECEKLQAEKY